MTHVWVLTLPVLFLAGDFGDLSSFSAGPQRHMGNSTAVVKHSYTFCKTLAGSLIPPAKCQERSLPLIVAKCLRTETAHSRVDNTVGYLWIRRNIYGEEKKGEMQGCLEIFCN